ncbi:hypothetical protein LG325_00685 [Marinobacter nauticus]
MAVSFIHVGMMKTASTYLQNVWLQDEQYALAFGGANEVVQYVRQSTLKGDFDPRHPMHIQLDKQPVKENNVIISSEGFSCGYLATTEERPLRAMIGNAAEILGSLKKETDSVLVCVRSPIAWMKSMHSQFINEGEFGDWARFYRCKETFLKEAMDLEFMLSRYEQHFGNVVVMPFEYLKNDEAKFWDDFSARFALPRPKVEVEVQNESLKGRRLQLLSSMNQLSHTLRQGLAGSDHPSPKEAEFLVDNDSKYSKWLHRRFCQHASEEKVAEACDQMGIEGDDPAFRKTYISDDMVEWIETRFIAAIEKRLNDPSLMDQYRAEVSQTPRG